MQKRKWLSRFLLSIATLLGGLTLLSLGGCGGGDGQSADPEVNDLPVAYVKRPLATNGQGNVMQLDSREELTFSPGAVLYVKPRATLSSTPTDVSSRVIGNSGDVKDVEFSYDGAKIIFSMRPEDPDPDDDVEPTWNIWEYTIATGVLQRVITADTVAEQGDDVAPHYLPGGRIVFSSDRQKKAQAILLDETIPNNITKQQFRALDEDENEFALVLHVMDADGGNIKQISFNQSHDLDPTVLNDGRILFTRWDHMAGRNQMSLYTMNPDGSDMQQLYGAHSSATGTNGATVHFLQPREMEDGRILTLLKRYTGTFEGGDLAIIDARSDADNNQSSVSGGNVNTETGISLGGRFSSAFPLWDGTGRALLSWSGCFVDIGGVDSACSVDPAAPEAAPRYGIFMVDLSAYTFRSIVTPQGGVMYTDVVAAQERNLPYVIIDVVDESDTDQVGIMHIRSVYDFDGTFDNLGTLNNGATAVTTIAELRDPGATPVVNRAARFIRVVKATSIPNYLVRDFNASAFGVSGDEMFEIVGYAPIEPDGSVKVEIPADVPLSIDVLNRNGQRIGSRHQNWIQVRPGQKVTCNGCHDHSSGSPHGRTDIAAASINLGAPVGGFENADVGLVAQFAETMAETRTRLDANALKLSVDISFTDLWTDDSGALTKAAPFAYRYDDLTTAPLPASPTCRAAWDRLCRVAINYEQHIYPLWSLTRTDSGAVDRTCTTCHTNGANDVLPDGQLDLTAGVSDLDASHFKAYRELVSDDNEQELQGGILIDRLVDSGQVDINGDPILVTVTVPRSMVPGSALSSTRFFSAFASTGTHYDTGTGAQQGWLTPAELKMVAEWVDNGAQYYNNPFDAPLN